MNHELIEEIELIGDGHRMTSIETPLRSDAFKKSDEEKINNTLNPQNMI